MQFGCFIIFSFISYLNTVSLHPTVVYKPTDFYYSRCFENGTNKVTCERVNISKERQEKESMWPPGPYAIPMSKYGCPEPLSRGWSKSYLKFNMTVLKNSSEPNSTVAGFGSEQGFLFFGDDFFKSPYRTESLVLYFCVKFRNKTTLDKGQWIPGNYSIYKIGSSCPTDFEEFNRTLPVDDYVSNGNVPIIEASKKGHSEQSITISMCKKSNDLDTGYRHTNATFNMLKTDFILEKNSETNCSHFDVSTVTQGETHCFYSPKVMNIDYGKAIELILTQETLSKFHQETDFEWYFLDCKRSFEVVMIYIQSSTIQNTYFKCFVNDAPWNLDESPVCNIENATVPGTIYLKKTRGRFFTFAFKENIVGDMSFKVYISSIQAHNGEVCFESIEIEDTNTIYNQVTASSSAYPRQLPSDTKYLFTGWIHNFTDLSPWILVDLIDLTTIEGVGIYFSKECEMWTSFNLHFGTIKDQLQMYKDMDFRIFPPEHWWNIDQMFTLPMTIKTRYLKFSDSFEKPSSKTRCFIFKLFGCKLTRITDLNSDSESEMWPIDQELRSEYSSFVENISNEKCKSLCRSQTNCTVASINDEKRCDLYNGSQLGIWKGSTNFSGDQWSTKFSGDQWSTNFGGDQWFAKLQNNVYIASCPRAKQKDGSFFGIIKYTDTESIITSVSYPFTASLNNDVQWIINFEAQHFVKLVFTNVSVFESSLIVGMSQAERRGIIINERYSDEVFIIETKINLVFLTAVSSSPWSPIIQFRAIVTAEEFPACLSLDSDLIYEKDTIIRKEICDEKKMIITSISYLNLYPFYRYYEEHFTIQAGKHRSIAIEFIKYLMLCQGSITFSITDGEEKRTFCDRSLPPKIYKSKGSTIHIESKYYPVATEGFNLQYKIKNHSFQRYANVVGPNSTVCSRTFGKCYTMIFSPVSWNIANTNCSKNNEQLVTIRTRKEMNYIQYLLRDQLYQQNKSNRKKDGKPKLYSSHIGLKRDPKERRRISFIWINNYSVTYSAWATGQPSRGDCTRTFFEYFNNEHLWKTEDCMNNNADFFICEAPYSEEGRQIRPNRKDDECKSVALANYLTASPLSGKTCQNWRNLSDKAKRDFDENFSQLENDLKNSTLCEDPILQDIAWCYVNDPSEYLREPCFLHNKNSIINPNNDSSDVLKCSDGSSIPRVNWCDKSFDCKDYIDELSCQNNTKDHILASSGHSVTKSYLQLRLQDGGYFRCNDSGEWISILAKCDNTIDCLDASDEVGCPNNDEVCDDSEVACDNGNCIKISQVCDFKSDCTDGTDELCEYQQCQENEYRCENKQCIRTESRCNAVQNCFDNSDERKCDFCKHSFLCAEELRCIPNRLTCDRFPDCKDGSDEISCSNGPVPTLTDLKDKYLWAGKYDKDENIEVDFEANGKQFGKITFICNMLIHPTLVKVPTKKEFTYDCFVENQIDCEFRFREAALVDNFDNMFAYPSCDCMIETQTSGGSSFKRCDGGEVKGSPGNDANIFKAETYSEYDNITTTAETYPTYYNEYHHKTHCSYEYNVSIYGEFVHCERDDKAIPKSMMCIYSLDESGYMTGCRSGDHLQNCGNFSCPESTVKCPGSYCIEQRFICDGYIQCPGGEDEQDCTCIDSDREVILFMADEDTESKETSQRLAKQFFTSDEKSIVRLLYFKSLHRSLKFGLTYRLLEIREECVQNNYYESTKCSYKTLARDLLERLQFSKTETRAFIVVENSTESSVVANLILSNLSQPAFSIFRVIKDFNSSLYRKDQYKFVKDIHISKWSSLYSIGFRRFPEICTEASKVPCAGMFRCSSSKQCIPFEQVCDNVSHCSNSDDERLCQSNCPQQCTCVGYIINCRAANISMTEILSLTLQARSADLSENPRIETIGSNQLRFPYMLHLNISSSEIAYIDRLAFIDLKNLLSLDLSNNRIRLLPEMVFSKLRHLTDLYLDRNSELETISSTAFQGLISVKSLNISGTNLKKISSLTFSGLTLDFIDISNNKIEIIENYAFNNSLVKKINFEGNNGIEFYKDIFYGVTSLRELRTPAFKFCCIRPCYVPEENCKPLKNEFSSCEDLMRNSVLQAFLWIVGIASLCGNFSSIIYRLVYDRERLKIGYGIFVTNLAAADFLMGVYLIMIAVTDAVYRNKYIYEDDQWRNSSWCTIAGVLSTVSSEASVFFLCMITLDRLLVIKFPFGTVRFSTMKAYVCSGVCWFISIILSIIPVLYTSHFQNKFYSKTGVCIALPLTRDKPPGWIYSVSIFVGLNFCTFILVAVGQVSIFTELRRSASSMKKTQKSRTRDLKVARNLILVATTDFLCWFPIGVMGILALNGFAMPSEVYAWSAVFILPINSALNPILYTVTAIIGKKSFNPSIGEQSNILIQKEVGSAILEYQEFSNSVRMKRELIPIGKMRSIQEILNDDRCLSVSFVAAVSKQLADYIRLLHESFIALDKITEENIYIKVSKTERSNPIVVIDSKTSLAADERAHQENIRQYGNLVRKLISKCGRRN